jgi:hypothetical protein
MQIGTTLQSSINRSSLSGSGGLKLGTSAIAQPVPRKWSYLKLPADPYSRGGVGDYKLLTLTRYKRLSRLIRTVHFRRRAFYKVKRRLWPWRRKTRNEGFWPNGK